MDDRDRVYSVLVVSAAAKFHTSLRGMLPEDRYEPLCAAGSVRRISTRTAIRIMTSLPKLNKKYVEWGCPTSVGQPAMLYFVCIEPQAIHFYGR